MGRIATDIATRSSEQIIMHRKDKARMRQASGGIPSSSSPPCSSLFCWSSGDCKEEAYNREEEADRDGGREDGLRDK
jgi:hypothetical protein